MTKLLEELVGKAAALPEDDQDCIAVRMIEAMADLRDDGPVPERHKRTLLERRELYRQSPGRLMPLEDVRQRFERERRGNADAAESGQGRDANG